MSTIVSVGITNDNFVKSAAISLSNNTITVDALNETKQTEGVNPLYKAFQETPCANSYQPYLVTGLNTSKVLIKQIDVPLCNKKKLEEALLYQIEPFIPFPLEDTLVDKISLSQTKEKTKIVFSTTNKSSLESHLQDFNLLGIEPEIVTTEAQALACFSEEFLEYEDYLLILNIGYTNSLITLIYNGIAIKAHTIPYGSQIFKSDKQSNENSYIAILLQEINKTILSLTSNLEKSHKIPLHITGNNIKDPLFTSALHKNFIRLEAPNLKEKYNAYALPIGQALIALPTYQKHSINFRKSDFIFPYPLKRYTKQIALFSLLSLSLTLILYFALTNNHNHKISELYDNYLVLSNEKTNIEKKVSLRELNQKLFNLEHKISAEKEAYLLLPNIPRVSDVIAWLSLLPPLHYEDQKPIINISSFHYVITKRPSLQKPNEPYQAKVTIKFSSLSSEQAKEFHESLLQSNDIIDLSNGVKWYVNNGIYTASFYLKQKNIKI